MSLYTDMIEAGQETDSNESDLYVKDTPEAREILGRHGKQIDGWNVQQFEIIFIRFDLARSIDLETHVTPYSADFSQRLGHGMEPSLPLAPSR